MTQQIKEGWSTAKAVFKSLEELVEAMSLVIVCAFTGYGALNFAMHPYVKYVLCGATGVIAIRAAGVWLDYLKRHAKDEKAYKAVGRK